MSIDNDQIRKSNKKKHEEIKEVDEEDNLSNLSGTNTKKKFKLKENFNKNEKKEKDDFFEDLYEDVNVADEGENEINNNKDKNELNINNNNNNNTTRSMVMNNNNDDNNNKNIINNTSSLDKLHYNQKNQRRQSYSELFMLKLNYVSNDIGLSQKSEGAYSNFYKDGKRVFDDLEKSNSLKNSFALSNSKTDLKEIKYKRRASLQPNFNFNFDFLNFEKNLKKKKKDNESDSSSSNDSNNSSFHSSENQSEDIETKAKKKIE